MPHNPYTTQYTSLSYRQSIASGVTNVQELAAEAYVRGLGASEAEVREVVLCLAEVEILEGSWFWHASGRSDRNRLRNVTRKMLSVTNPITIRERREGAG